MAEPKSEYVLINDVTGTGPIKRGPQLLKAVYYEKTEQGDVKQEIEFKVPFPPKEKCKKCYGRGYVGLVDGIDVIKEVVICQKCFPML